MINTDLIKALLHETITHAKKSNSSDIDITEYLLNDLKLFKGLTLKEIISICNKSIKQSEYDGVRIIVNNNPITNKNEGGKID